MKENFVNELYKKVYNRWGIDTRNEIKFADESADKYILWDGHTVSSDVGKAWLWGLMASDKIVWRVQQVNSKSWKEIRIRVRHKKDEATKTLLLSVGGTHYNVDRQARTVLDISNFYHNEDVKKFFLENGKNTKENRYYDKTLEQLGLSKQWKDRFFSKYGDNVNLSMAFDIGRQGRSLFTEINTIIDEAHEAKKEENAASAVGCFPDSPPVAIQNQMAAECRYHPRYPKKQKGYWGMESYMQWKCKKRYGALISESDEQCAENQWKYYESKYANALAMRDAYFDFSCDTEHLIDKVTLMKLGINPHIKSNLYAVLTAFHKDIPHWINAETGIIKVNYLIEQEAFEPGELITMLNDFVEEISSNDKAKKFVEESIQPVIKHLEKCISDLPKNKSRAEIRKSVITEEVKFN